MGIVASWMEQGLERGQQKTQVKIVCKMLQEDIPLETSAHIIGLPIAQLQHLQSQAEPE